MTVKEIANLLEEMKKSEIEKLKISSISNQWESNDSGKYGKTLEMLIKAYNGNKIVIAKQGATDLRKGNKCYEIKSNGGELGESLSNLVKGSSMVIYFPYIDVNTTLLNQEGFVIDKPTFLKVLENAGALRKKVKTSGDECIAIKSVYNMKTQKPISEKFYNALLNGFYEEIENGNGMTFEEWIGE